MDTPLASYMDREKIGDAEFAALIDKDRTLVNRLRRGKVRPTLDMAFKIESATKGAVPVNAWGDDTTQSAAA